MTSNRMQPPHAQKQGKPMKTNSVQQVFQKYEDIGFLYPAKKQLLAPHFTSITLCFSGEKKRKYSPRSPPRSTKIFLSGLGGEKAQLLPFPGRLG